MFGCREGLRGLESRLNLERMQMGGGFDVVSSYDI